MREFLLCGALGLGLLACMPAKAQDGAAPPLPPRAEPAETGAIAPSTLMDAAPEAREAAPPEAWIGKPILSADGVEVGEVEDVVLDADGRPEKVKTEVGGFLGFGTTLVELPVDAADFDGEEVRVGMVETDISALAEGGPNSPAVNRAED